MRTFPDLKPLSEPPLKAVLDQLGCVYRNAPLWPGDTLSHGIARRCRDLGLIRRNEPGNWIPTRLGSVVYWLGHRWTKRTMPHPRSLNLTTSFGTVAYAVSYALDYSKTISSCDITDGLGIGEVIVDIKFKWWCFIPRWQEKIRTNLEETMPGNAVAVGLSVTAKRP